MPVWLVAIATVFGSALIAGHPANPRSGGEDPFVFEASAFSEGANFGLGDQGGHLTLTADAPSSQAFPEYARFGVAESVVRRLGTPVSLREYETLLAKAAEGQLIVTPSDDIRDVAA